MDVIRTLNPGQDGTKTLSKHYGEQLICVRYRHDKTRQRRLKTVELIIEDIPWAEPETPHHRPLRPTQITISEVLVKIGYEEVALRQKAKLAGARWIKEEKAWLINYQLAKQLGIENRIIKLVKENELPF